MTALDVDRHDDLDLPANLRRGVADLFPHQVGGDPDLSLTARMSEAQRSGRPLRVKLGIDPTGSEIHLGHSILFRKLRAFQDAGNTAVLIIGDFTARIGDPTGKSSTRVQLSAAQVEENARTYLRQLGEGKPASEALLDFETPGRLEVRRNSEWLEALDLSCVIDLLAMATVGQILAKDDFSQRYGDGIPISLHEFLYPLLQGYDSVAVAADVELGGTDQKFNVAMGRDLQRQFGIRPQFGLLMPILPGTDGVQKMSKSLGNCVSLQDDALTMYSQLEKLADSIVETYVTLLTNLDPQGLPDSPRERQQAMALAVTACRHGAAAAREAMAAARSLVGGARSAGPDSGVQAVPELTLEGVSFPATAFYLLRALKLSDSSSAARRSIQGGAVRLDGQRLDDPNITFEAACQLHNRVLQIGKKTFRRLVTEPQALTRNDGASR